MGDPSAQPDRPSPAKGRAHDYSLTPVKTQSRGGFGWTWIATLALCAVLWPLLTLAVINHYTDTTTNFIHELIERKDVALARHPPAAGGRYVIIGGSDALFGIDAEQLQRRSGVPVVNGATHAALGIEYTLDRAKRILRPGDTAIIEFAYGMWSDPAGDFGQYEFDYFTTYDKGYFLRMPPVRAIKALYGVPLGKYRDSIRYWREYRKGRHFDWRHMYAVATMDANGDLRQEVIGSFAAPTTGIPFSATPPARTLAAFEAFCDWARVNNVKLCHTWPTYVRPEKMSAAAATPPAWMTDLLNRQDVTQLDHPADTLYPIDWFYDTDKHLNSAARRVRTAALGDRLGFSAIGPGAEPWMWLMATPDAGLAPLSNWPERQGPVRPTYLVQWHDPATGAMTAELIVDAVHAGVDVFYDDLSAEPALALAGLGHRIDAEQRVNLAGFLARHEGKVALVTRNTGVAWSASATTGLPPALASALGKSEPFAALVGIGADATVSRVAPSLVGRASDLTAIPGPRLDLDARPGNGILRINQRDAAPAASGVRVAVLDPAAGLLVDGATFPDESSTVVVLRRRQVALEPPPTPTVGVDPTTMIATGSAAPTVRYDGPSTTILPGAAEGVWGLSIPDHAPDAALILDLSSQAGRRYTLGVFTNRPELFDYLPATRSILCDGRTPIVALRWKLRPGATFAPGDYALAGLSVAPGTPPVTVDRLRTLDFSQ